MPRQLSHNHYANNNNMHPHHHHSSHHSSSNSSVHSASPTPMDEPARMASPFVVQHRFADPQSAPPYEYEGDDSEGVPNGTNVHSQKLKTHYEELSESPTPPSIAIHYKTRWCRSIRENGFCKYGDACSFAHAESELRAFGGKDSIFGRQFADLDDQAVQAFLEKKRLKRGMMDADRDITSHPLYKTRMCSKIDRAEGCDLGDACRYAHSTSELRPLPPSSMMGDDHRQTNSSPWYGHSSVPSPISNGSPPLAPHPNPSMPPSLLNGSLLSSPVLLSSSSSSAFPTPPRSVQQLSSSASNSSSGNSSSSSRMHPDVYHPATYKTQLCPDHDTVTGCPLGKRCMLAHGIKDLRRDPTVVQYSGKKCTEYTMNGSCIRGDLCGMAHGDNERTYHPDNYKTKICMRGVDCEKWRYGTCPYIHKEDSYLDNPKHLSSVSAVASTPPTTPPPVGQSSVKAILRTLGLEKYESVFTENEIDAEAFSLLNKDALKDLGIPYGPSLKILNYVRGVGINPQDVQQSSASSLGLIGLGGPLSAPLPTLSHSASTLSLNGLSSLSGPVGQARDSSSLRASLSSSNLLALSDSIWSPTSLHSDVGVGRGGDSVNTLKGIEAGIAGLNL
ncbi:hypothetical protein SmJEL517_g03094 [Synchytrium microbalum]|uniref:Uncharacterized protein n=1 Tax=Synchytrium microbalum TaxID=1806994 RepID=A0A507C9I0_9FUNG|nr:uncharacterized protein SmJEL517_g03094 [Synchytrium microbalum]TPX34165.1 hypothetical protein SmJEL517_g03094 [Synchytrium microbalum]